MEVVKSETRAVSLYQKEEGENAFRDIPEQMRKKYKFVREIGHGTQGHVYEAYSIRDRKHVAIKKLDISSVSNWKMYDLFHREADALARIDVDGTAMFYEALEFLNSECPAAFIVQAYVEGKSLADMLAENHRFTQAQIYNAAVKLLEILKNLSSYVPPIVHRDIKPSNIMLSPDEEGNFNVCLIDFGAVANPQIQGGGSTVAGTYGYMPPEQLMGKPEPASDIYALAATLVHWLSGVDPADMQVADFRLIIEPHVENLPHIVVSTLRQMLSPSVETRLCDYDKLIELFKTFQSENALQKADMLSVMAQQSLDKRLADVKYLGQTGNIDIWNAIPDKVPRKLPDCYNKILVTRKISHKSIVDNRDDPNESIAANRDEGAIVLWVIFGIISIALLYIWGSELLTYLWEQNKLLSGLALLIIVFVLFMIIRFIYRKIKNSRMFMSYKMKKLYHNGRKTIATVVSIQYIPVKKKMLSRCENKSEGKLYYCSDLPRFEIKYQFNPPDDVSEDALVHRIISHNDPHGCLKPGDPLPIMYWFPNHNNEDVVSMPVPLPLGDISDIQNIVGMNGKVGKEHK